MLEFKGIGFNCRNISQRKHVWNVHFKNCYFETVFSCMCCDFHTSFSWITLKMRIITSGGLCCFSRSPTPQLAWIASFSASVEQRGSTGQHSLSTLLFLGVAKRWLPGCSATIQNARFLHLFPRQLTFKGARGGSGYWLFALDQHSACTSKLFGSTCYCFIIYLWRATKSKQMQTACKLSL